MNTEAARKYILLLVVSVGLAGCATARDAYMVDSLTKEGNKYRSVNPYTQRKNLQLVPPPFDLDNEKFPENVGDNSAPSAYKLAIDNNDIETRNRLMDTLVKRSRLICEAHKASIVSNSATANFSFGSITSLLTGLGTIFTPASTVRALSGSAAIVNATRSEFNNVFYQNLLATAVVKSIELQRTKKFSELIVKRSDDVSVYSVDTMLSEIVQYHELCSFYSGLVSLTDAAARVVESSVELTSRINALEERLKKNRALLSGASTEIERTRLNEMNEQIVRDIQQLTIQKTLTQGGGTAVNTDGG